MSEVVQNISNFVATIAKISHITYLANEIFIMCKNRRWWVRPVNLTREEEGFFKTCFQQLQEKDEEHFFKVTRMSTENFNLLLTLLREKLRRFSNRKAICPETRLAMTLMFLAQGCNYNVLAWTFKMGVSTVKKIIYETCDAIWDELHIVYLSPPNRAELAIIAEKFFIKTGMPNCLGAIDGKHINIVRPSKSGALYFNYKKTHSIVLMAACDANYLFTYIDIGALGSQSDGGVFARSSFGNKILNGTLEIPHPTNLPGTAINFPYYFVGDNAFPLKTNLMRPFPGIHLSDDKEKYNIVLSKARVHIENTFGILASRWRILLTTISACPKNADKIVLATLVLHNFLMLQHDRNYFTLELVDRNEHNREISGQWRGEINPLESFQQRVVNRSSSHAFELRNSLKEFLNTTF
ncbi:putative nuclease HARBI1 [Eurosta solidaginis]|uniref:putative nuclease HARBI1 n=1 Tax=Eurosta solidaginis TaxID=178769 RepID=UPI0035315919